MSNNRILVSHLPTDLTGPEIMELFSTAIGPVSRVVTQPSSSSSQPAVIVEFSRAGDGVKAVERYHGARVGDDAKLSVEIHSGQANTLAAQQHEWSQELDEMKNEAKEAGELEEERKAEADEATDEAREEKDEADEAGEAERELNEGPERTVIYRTD